MTKKDEPIIWDDKHQQSFTMVKQLLTAADVMAYFGLLHTQVLPFQ